LNSLNLPSKARIMLSINFSLLKSGLLTNLTPLYSEASLRLDFLRWGPSLKTNIQNIVHVVLVNKLCHSGLYE
jgi:hypothetical protein